jgi:hypothetical protein
MNPLSFTIDRRVIKAARVFASSDETRFILCGVFLEIISEKQAIVSATDGRRLIKIRTDIESVKGYEKPTSVIIPKALIDAKAIKKKKKSAFSNTLVVTISDHPLSGRSISFADALGEMSLSMREVDGEYPDTSKVVPKEAQKASGVAINFRMFGELQKVAETLKGNRGGEPGGLIYQSGNGVCVIHQSWGGLDVVVLIMPMRVEGPEKLDLPSWATAEVVSS